MSRYKLIIERHQVTLVDTETQEREIAGGALIHVQAQHFLFRCTVAGINIETEDRR